MDSFLIDAFTIKIGLSFDTLIGSFSLRDELLNFVRSENEIGSPLENRGVSRDLSEGEKNSNITVTEGNETRPFRTFASRVRLTETRTPLPLLDCSNQGRLKRLTQELSNSVAP
jgi:hypothetical protein